MKKCIIFMFVLFGVFMFVSCEKEKSEREAYWQVKNYYWNTYYAELSDDCEVLKKDTNYWWFEGVQTRRNGYIGKFFCAISYSNGEWKIGSHY